MDGHGDGQFTPDLAALIGSRICHDLISPVGVISNGLELLMLSGAPDGPEMHLLRSSADHANARLRFFRVAFGLSAEGQTMPQGDITAILGDVFTGPTAVDWQLAGAQDRPLVQAAFLAISCAETALPHGGRITVEGAPEAITLTASGDRLMAGDDHWQVLAQGGTPTNLSAAQVQFALLPAMLARLGREVTIMQENKVLTVNF